MKKVSQIEEIANKARFDFENKLISELDLIKIYGAYNSCMKNLSLLKEQ